MRALACVAVLVACALATSACAGGHPSTTGGTKTEAQHPHETSSGSLPASLKNFIHSTIAGPGDGPISEIDVYGPGSRAALVKASSGDIVYPTARETTMQFYLIVFHGHFVCTGCSGPAGHKPPQGTIETRVWSPAEGGTDFGIQDSLPTAASRLNRLAVITLS
jgi:hypothetical protein